MKPLHDLLLKLPMYEELLESARKKELPVLISDVSAPQKAHFARALCEHLNLPCLFVTYNELQAAKLYADLSCFFGENIVLFKERDMIFYDVEAAGADLLRLRLEAISKIRSFKGSFAVVASVDSLLCPTISKKRFDENTLSFKVGEEYDLEELIASFVNMGYVREDAVRGRGQFSVRGGILDFFSYSAETPIRIEFFDNEIDSIRLIDIESQISVEKADEAVATPVTEIIISGEERESIIKAIKSELCERENAVLKSDLQRIAEKQRFPSVDKYIPFIETGSVTDYMGDDYIFILDEPAKAFERAENHKFEKEQMVLSMLEKELIFGKNTSFFYDFSDVIKKNKSKMMGFSTLYTSSAGLKFKKHFPIPGKELLSYQGRMELLTDELTTYKNKGYSVVIMAGNKSRAEALCQTLSSMNIPAIFKKELSNLPEKGEIFVTCGSISHGFAYPSLSFVIIGDSDILPSRKKLKIKKQHKSASTISDISDLTFGDYVVHQNYGIGEYRGIQQLTYDGVTKDYVKIKYDGSDCLYVPTNQLELINKFIGTEGRSVRLSKMDSVQWNKTKQRVKESCKELAEGLALLYAARMEAKGHAFSRDAEWQRDFESKFPFEETEDQLRCITEAKKDMESSRPMDRLLCGDVGYGKTEVALRAAFKAVTDSKQVCYLVPTTILARQHYINFKERMAGYPINIEMLSRFRTKAQQAEIVKKLKKGEIDIVIGTHRLLSKDLQFSDLGLLIIDEEQRFGVAHKERLKEIKNTVDVLTLTATPIPRTLHMAMSGIRDMSVIENPPEDRYPVSTFVMEYDREIILDAIKKELSRGGQVYYLYNRVHGINKAAAELSAALPDASIDVIHGQMSEKQIEDGMIRVLEKETDVLVCTTIIETGLDIPNVNTIIIEDSDRMGLSQLYQLRGRVGRSNRLAYAYLTFRKNKQLSEVAEKRLKAIKEFTEFGSGFKIAMRDLEIRGAGNILGSEQHGHMDLVGYDLYCRLLKSAVSELRGIKEEEKVETLVDIKVSAYIPEVYIKNHESRIEIYKKISHIENDTDASDIIDELVDRFGDIPPSVEALVDISLIKAYASELLIKQINQEEDKVLFYFKEGMPIPMEKLSRLIAENRGKIMLSAGVSPYFSYRLSGKNEKQNLANIKSLLQMLKAFD